jgi:hypothetical protein
MAKGAPPSEDDDVLQIRLDDPQRKPRSYTDIVRPGQIIVFARDVESGAACDARGQRFADPSAASCLVFDAFDDARTFCETAVLASPSIRFDVFDSGGRVRPPLMTVLHPSRAASLDGDPGAMRRRRILAWLLIAGGFPPIAYAYFFERDIGIVLPAFVGINMIIAGGRLLWFNLGIRETERERQERLDRLER